MRKRLGLEVRSRAGTARNARRSHYILVAFTELEMHKWFNQEKRGMK